MGRQLRGAVLIIGAVFLTIAVAVLISGYDRLGSLTTCLNSGECPVGLYSQDTEIHSLIDAARLELIYGIAFSFISGILVFFGILGSNSKLSEKSN